jgi:UDP-N-acetylglucosamine 2-epimerase (non-hydrolysing)
MRPSMKILFVFGTRPEAIKMAPLVKAMRAAQFDVTVCVTGQHREMLDQVLKVFSIEPEIDLAIMRPNQTLSGIAAAVLQGLDNVFKMQHFDWVIVQGDTTTTTAAALCAFYNKVKVAHLEAGLRTRNRYAPWPEEINRVLATQLADLHLAPTGVSKQNLLDDGVAEERIHVTGNSVIDALFEVRDMIAADAELQAKLKQQFSMLDPGRRLILVTGHRRENFGGGFESICRALASLVERNPDVEIIYPVHLNPNVQEPVRRILGGKEGERVHLVEPVDYVPIVYLMDRAHFIITDSGGIQEEAPSFGKPVLVMRETTERPEAVDAGTVRLVGTDADVIVSEAERLLRDPAHYASMSRAHNPYGDGKTSARIVELFRKL